MYKVFIKFELFFQLMALCIIIQEALVSYVYISSLNSKKLKEKKRPTKFEVYLSVEGKKRTIAPNFFFTPPQVENSACFHTDTFPR